MDFEVTTYHTLMAFWFLYVLLQAFCMVAIKQKSLQRIHDYPMGPQKLYIPKSIAWKLISVPAIPSILYFFWTAKETTALTLNDPGLIFVCLYCLHYSYRTFVFPYRIRVKEQRYSIILIFITWTYYIPMGYFLGNHFASAEIVETHLQSPIFWLGLFIFTLGLAGNIVHDEILVRLRTGPSKTYKIPQKGLFQYTSNAHYFSEIVEWAGFLVLSLSLPALLHLLAVFILMIPQAMKTHRWYKNYFGDRYPSNRKALIPFVF